MGSRGRWQRFHFPLWQYLKQPVFSRQTEVVWNPVKFWQQYRLRHLEGCWSQEVIELLEQCWQQPCMLPEAGGGYLKGYRQPNHLQE
jgi:hypothetical protein